MMKYDVYYKAFKELREIISFFPENEYKKIPNTFINFIEKNMDTNYEYVVTHIDDFQNQEMLEETKVLLSLVYRDFIDSSEEKKQIIQKEKDELYQDTKKIKEKYSPENIYENIEKKHETEEISTAMVEYKESIFAEIINWFKRTF